MSKFKFIKGEMDLDFVISACKQTRYACIDFETSGLKYYDDWEKPLIMGICYQPGCAWVLPLQHKESKFKRNNQWLRMIRRFAKEVLENPDIIKVAWNIKFELKWFYTMNIFPNFRLMDAMLAKYCLDEERPHGLKEMVAKVFPEYANYEKAIAEKAWKDKPLKPLSKYCSLDCDLTLRLFIYFESRIMEKGFYLLFRNLLMTSTSVLAKSETRGMPVNEPYLSGMVDVYGKRIEIQDALLRKHKKLMYYQVKKSEEIRFNGRQELLEEIKLVQESDRAPGIKARMINGRQEKIAKLQSAPIIPLNFNAPGQLGDYLFVSPHGLKLKPIKNTDSGAPSTDEESLEALKKKDKSGFMEQMLDYRGLSKLYSTYMKGIQPLLDSNNRVHTSFLVHGTVTGRLSSKEPNLQNIPRDTTSSDIKKMFITPLGFVLLEVDYSQAELRVVAELANDKVMIDIFQRGYNIHVATACLTKGEYSTGSLDQYDKVKALIKIGDSMGGAELAKPGNELYLFWVKQKKKAKTINFGILYGQGPDKLADGMGSTREEAVEFTKQWMSTYPGVRDWIRKQKIFVHEHGYVMNLFGRKRRLYNIDHPNKWIRAEAERQAVNTPIQGCASDFTLFSSVIIDQMIMEGKLPWDMHQLYTVHDSIGYAIRPKDIHWVVPIITEVCNNPDTLKYFGFELKKVRMKVSAEVGKTWGDLTEYKVTEDYTKLLKTPHELFSKTV